jgi:hypothetical protein
LSTNTILATTPLVSTNYLLRATGTTIGNSLIFDNGTNVGIGNTNTSYTLDVSGTGNFTGALSGTSATFSGNLAIAGQTLSAWGGTFGVMQSYYGSYFGGTSGGGTVMGNNNYFDGTNYKYINTDFAGQIQIGGGNILLRVAPSGTAGNNVTYTNALTIASTGAATFSSSVTISGSNDLIFRDASTYITSPATDTLRIITANTERMRITSNGYFKFSNDGTYYNPTGTYNEIRQAAGSGEVIYGTTTSATYTGTMIAMDATRAANTAFNFYAGNANSVAQFKVSGTGVIYAQNTSVQAISSDIKLKTDIVDFDKGLNEILAIKPRYYKYKDNLEVIRAGFIAQEMDVAIPGSMIDGEPNKDGESFKTYQVDWYPMLVKAIQEQQAMITSLQSQINELKNK